MSPGASADPEPDPTPLRLQYSAELDQLRLQVELMGVRVDENLERMRELLDVSSESLAALALEADDDIDAMNVSLTERCYHVLARETPVASDLRLVLAVVRVSGEPERTVVTFPGAGELVHKSVVQQFLIEREILFNGSMFISARHTADDVARTLDVFERACAGLVGERSVADDLVGDPIQPVFRAP